MGLWSGNDHLGVCHLRGHGISSPSPLSPSASHVDMGNIIVGHGEKYCVPVLMGRQLQ